MDCQYVSKKTLKKIAATKENIMAVKSMDKV